MQLHKLSFSLFFLLLSSQTFAKLPKDLLKKINQACLEFERYEIRFERHFKYPLEQDTVSELYKSAVFRTDIDYYIGWHRVSYLKSEVERSLIASNMQGLHRVNFNDNLYYSNLLKDNEKLLIQNLNANVYQPLLYSKADWNAYELKDKKENSYILFKTDTVRDGNKRIKYIANSTVTIDRNTSIPVSEETVTISGKRQQYFFTKLLDYKFIEKDKYKSILIKADSFIQNIHTYTDGDSLKASKKELYKKVRIGDKVSAFNGLLANGDSFDFNDYKDSTLVFDFFYTTCAPCISAVPELNKLYATLHPKGLQLYGINAFASDWDNLTNYIKDYQVTFPLLKTDKDVVYNFGVTGFPRLFVVHKGVIVKIYYGYTKGMENQMIQYLESLLASP